MRIYAHFLRAKDSFGGKDAKNIAVRTRQDRPPPLIFLLVWGQKPTPKRRATPVIQRGRILARPAHRIAQEIQPSDASRSQISNGTQGDGFPSRHFNQPRQNRPPRHASTPRNRLPLFDSFIAQYVWCAICVRSLC